MSRLWTWVWTWALLVQRRNERRRSPFSIYNPDKNGGNLWMVVTGLSALFFKNFSFTLNICYKMLFEECMLEPTCVDFQNMIDIWFWQVFIIRNDWWLAGPWMNELWYLIANAIAASEVAWVAYRFILFFLIQLVLKKNKKNNI